MLKRKYELKSNRITKIKTKANECLEVALTNLLLLAAEMAVLIATSEN